MYQEQYVATNPDFTKKLKNLLKSIIQCPILTINFSQIISVSNGMVFYIFSDGWQRSFIAVYGLSGVKGCILGHFRALRLDGGSPLYGSIPMI